MKSNFLKSAIMLVVLIAIVGLFTPAAAAQNHSAKVGFTPGVPTGTQLPATSFKLYRAAADAGPYVNVGSCTASAPYTCTDTSVLGAQTYFFYVTGLAGTLESAPSVHISATIPPDTAPPPPTNLNIVSVAMNNYGSTTQVVATWTAPVNETITWYILDSTGAKLATGTSRSALGTYSLDKTFRNGVLFRAPSQIKVCDSTNVCDAQSL